MTDPTTAGDLRGKHLEQEVRVSADGHSYGVLSGRLGLVFQMGEATNLALWRGEKCVQITIPSTTKVEVMNP